MRITKASNEICSCGGIICIDIISATEQIKYCPICEYRKQANEGKKWCYDCENYYSPYYCGYAESKCKIYGSLDMGSDKHPDTTADTCEHYKRKNQKLWFER